MKQSRHKMRTLYILQAKRNLDPHFLECLQTGETDIVHGTALRKGQSGTLSKHGHHIFKSPGESK